MSWLPGRLITLRVANNGQSCCRLVQQKPEINYGAVLFRIPYIGFGPVGLKNTKRLWIQFEPGRRLVTENARWAPTDEFRNKAECFFFNWRSSFNVPKNQYKKSPLKERLSRLFSNIWRSWYFLRKQNRQ